MSDQEFHKVTLVTYDFSKYVSEKLKLSESGISVKNIFFSSVKVYSNEYFIRDSKVHSKSGDLHPSLLNNKNVTVVEKVMGITYIPKSVFGDFLGQLGKKYEKDVGGWVIESHLTNNFTEEILDLLVSKKVPNEVKNFPFKLIKSTLAKDMKEEIEAILGKPTVFMSTKKTQETKTKEDDEKTKKETKKKDDDKKDTGSSSSSTTTNSNMFPGFGSLFGQGNSNSSSSNTSTQGGNPFANMMSMFGNQGNTNSSTTNTNPLTSMFNGGGNPMQNPMMQNLLSNPQMLSGMLQNPMVQQMMLNNPMFQNNPMMRQMLANPQMLTNMLSNPMVQQMMANPQFMQNAMRQRQHMFGGGNTSNNQTTTTNTTTNTTNTNTSSVNNPFSMLFGNQNTSNTQQSVKKEEVEEKIVPFKETDEIFRFKKAKVSSVTAKLLKLCGEKMSQGDKKLIENLKTYLVNRGKKDVKEKIMDFVTKETFLLFKDLIKGVDEEHVYPVLDLLRLLLLAPEHAETAMEMKDSPLAEVVPFVHDWDDLSMPTQLMVLRLYCNLFSVDVKNTKGAYFIIMNQKNFEDVAEVISTSLGSALGGIRTAAASLAANISRFVLKNGDDEETQILCSCIEYVQKEKKDDIIYLLLLAMWRILKDNKNAIDLAEDLKIDFMQIRKNAKSDKSINLLKNVEKMLKK